MSLSDPVVVRLSRIMPGPAPVVWDLITDWENQGDWMLEASDFVVLSEQREGVGVVAEATVKIAGISTRDKVRVTGWEAERRLKIAHEGWVAGEGELILTGLTDGRTRLDWIETLHPPWGGIGGLGLRATVPAMRRIFKRDLRVLESLVRAKS